MIKVLLISSLILYVNCILKGFEDSEALSMAQEISGSLLEPPKDVYEKIMKDLSDIRKQFPAVANIKHHSMSSGSIICKTVTKESAAKLNTSEFGPVIEHRMGSLDYDVLTFSKPYNTKALIEVLAKKGLATGCSVDRVIGLSSDVTVGPNDIYVFYKGSGDCPSGCINKQFWTFSVKEGKVTLVKQTGSGINSS